MKQNLFLNVIILFLFTTSIFGFNSSVHENLIINSGQKSSKMSTIVYPNASTGILNLLCTKKLTPPITAKATTNKGLQIILASNLPIDGIEFHKFIQLNTLSLRKGEYNIEFSDIHGNLFTRRIYLEK